MPRIGFAYEQRNGQWSFLALLHGIYRARLTSSLENPSRRALASEYIVTCRPLAHHYRCMRAAAIAWIPFVVETQPIIAADRRRRRWLTAKMGVAMTRSRLLMLDRSSMMRLRIQAVGLRWQGIERCLADRLTDLSRYFTCWANRAQWGENFTAAPIKRHDRNGSH